MMIGEFAQRTGLSQDTIRFYVRKGLLAPQSGAKGGRNPYQVFVERDVSTARMIRCSQSLGMSLKEIAAIVTEGRSKGLSRKRKVELMEAHLAYLEQQQAQLAELTNYLRAKRDWVAQGKQGDEPCFSDEDLELASGRARSSRR